MPLTARQELQKAEEDYRRQAPVEAIEKLDRLIRDFPNTRQAAHAHYLRALCQIRQRNRSAARADAQRCLELSRDPLLSAKAQATLGSIHMEVGNRTEALRCFEQALEHLPDTPPTDQIRFDYALCLRAEGQWAKARKQCELIGRKYPGSPVEAGARRALEWPGDYYSIQCSANRDAATASKLADSLKKTGLPARVEPRTRSGEQLHMVYVGRYLRLDQAEDALRSVKPKVADAHVVP